MEAKQYGNFTYGFLTGGLLIGGLALLFAPKKGSKLRKDINKATDDLMNSAGNYLNSAKDAAGELLTDGKSKLNNLIHSAEGNELVDSTGKYLNNAMDRTDDLIQKGKEKVSKLLDSDTKHKSVSRKHAH